MNCPRNEYTVFISYFGTYLSNGTKGLALQAKAFDYGSSLTVRIAKCILK